MALGTYLSIITLNVNGLNAPTKRHRVVEWIRKQDIYILTPRDPSQIKRYTQTKSKGLEKDVSFKWKRKKKAGVTVVISDKIDFKIKAIEEAKKDTT